MTAAVKNADAIVRGNLRCCRLRRWTGYDGFGFSVKRVSPPPHVIEYVESNSPAAASGLNGNDAVLAVNDKDMTHTSYDELTTALKKTRDSDNYVDLLVINEKIYRRLQKKNQLINPRHAKIIETPRTMPIDYKDFKTQELFTSESSISDDDDDDDDDDVIVVCSSSQYLFKSICKAGGDSVSTSYNQQISENPDAPIIIVATAGGIASKKIYFLPWKADSDEYVLCKSIKRFVSLALKKAIEQNYRRIAFPAIGCGQFGCSISLVADAMVGEVHRKSRIHDISVTFVIQPDRNDIYDEFKKQIDLLESPSPSSKLRIICATFGKGDIEVEMGDITKQKVDVIVGSTSSGILTDTIINAAGKESQLAYEMEITNHPNSALIAIPSGSLSCKKIFFVKWEPNDNEEILRQSLIDLISIVVQNVISHKFTSIAFPAIGCGKHACSVDIVVQTMVYEMKKHLIQRKLSWRVKFVVNANQENVYDEFCKQVLTTEDGFHEATAYQLPATWEKSAEDKIRFTLSTKVHEYKSIVSNFDQAMKGKYTNIIKIERIQNERWYMQYLAHSKDFRKRLEMNTEKRLYHGCPEQAANAIIADCFNRSYAGVNGTVYGVGVYFSSDATYSHGYTKPNASGERCMFLSRVLVGKTTKGNSTMRTRPLGFDSTTDEKHIFVTYHDAQALAEYLITYK
ncbi:unnamed protein product [Rotaria socialis]|uniref:Poly [ADP-ribose] polymerase n=1 Tax=Rotaria socialis TaxID=392032 RepID=A0A817U4T7_9BILA|nr:unnamed protein product [Rotaria socialis]